MPAVSGYRGRVLLDGKIFLANRWSIEYSLESDEGSGTASIPDQDFLHSSTNADRHRYPIKILYPRIIEITVDVSGFYDTSQGYFSTSGIPNQTYPALNFYLSPGRTIKLRILPDRDEPNREGYLEAEHFLITQVSLSGEVRGIVSFKFTGKVNSKNFHFVKM